MIQNQTTIQELKKAATPAVRPAEQASEIGFYNGPSYALLQAIAKDFAASEIVPKHFQGKAPNCMIAINMAVRMQADPLMVMQNLYIVHGTPGWSAQFLISCFNQCGRFDAIQYEFVGKEGTDDWGCRAVSVSRESGTKVVGSLVTIGMAKKEGWYGKNGSKWATMPEQMLRYRSAAWMIRTCAPEIGMGFKTRDEIEETYDLEKNTDGRFEVQSAEIVSQPEKKAVEVAAKKQETEKKKEAQAGVSMTVFCPNKNRDVDELDCPLCPNREGCPSWD